MTDRTRTSLLALIAVLIAFLIGAGWQLIGAREARSTLEQATAQLDSTRTELDFEQLQSTLALAAVAAQFGNFERSRQLTSDFFTELQATVVQAPEAGRGALEQILATRDATITLLSRAQPEAALGLARMLVEFRRALGRDGAGLEPAVPAAPSSPDTIR